MTLEELQQTIQKYSIKQISGSTKQGAGLYPIYLEILNHTSFLPSNTQLRFRIYYINNNLISPKKCICGCNQDLLDPRTMYLRGHGNKIKEIKEKKISSYLTKYGVSNPSKHLDIRNKIKDTCIKKFGAEHYMKSNIVRNTLTKDKRDSIYEKMLNNLYFPTKNFIPLFSREEFEGIIEKEYAFKCVKCNNTHTQKIAWAVPVRCYICNPILINGGTPVVEKELGVFIRSLIDSNDSISFHNRQKIHPQELDIYIPSKNIAIEFNGLYWHSEGNGKYRDYHLQKTNICEQNNIRLIHIFEDEWIHKKNIVKSRLRHLFNKCRYSIYARDCIIREIEPADKNKFLNKYHIQGSDKSCIYLGAFYKNRLVAVETFSKLRAALGSVHKEDQYELSRFCTISIFNVIGIAGKFLSYFEKKYNPKQIISYADKRWSIGGLYNKLGFTLDHISLPNYWYIKNNTIRHHRFGFQKHLLKDKLETFDSNLTEWENMKANGYDRIWDCGNYVFVKKYESKE